MREDLHVAVVGATGAVGIEMLKTLEKRNFPVGKLSPLASARSAGKTLSFRGEDVAVQVWQDDDLEVPAALRVDELGGHDIDFSASHQVERYEAS